MEDEYVRVLVLTKPSCVQCTATFNALNHAEVEYASIDLSVITDALKMAAQLGFTQAPIVMVNDGTNFYGWSGFRPELIEELARQQKVAA